MLRSSYLGYVVKAYKEKQAVLTTAVVLDFVYNVIQTISMPYPKEVLDDLLDLVQLLVPSLKTTTDNKMKGFFLEFVEQCVDLKPSGVDSKRVDAIVSSMSSVTYICCSLCLTTNVLSSAKRRINVISNATVHDKTAEGRGVRENTQALVRLDVLLSWTR